MALSSEVEDRHSLEPSNSAPRCISREQVSKWCSLRIPKPPSGVLQGQNYFLNNAKVLFALLHSVDIRTDGARAMAGETAGAGA